MDLITAFPLEHFQPLTEGMAVISAMQAEKPGHCICTLTLGEHNAFIRSGRDAFCVYAACCLGWGSQERGCRMVAAQRLRISLTPSICFCTYRTGQKALSKAGPESGWGGFAFSAADYKPQQSSPWGWRALVLYSRWGGCSLPGITEIHSSAQYCFLWNRSSVLLYLYLSRCINGFSVCLSWSSLQQMLFLGLF